MGRAERGEIPRVGPTDYLQVLAGNRRTVRFLKGFQLFCFSTCAGCTKEGEKTNISFVINWNST